MHNFTKNLLEWRANNLRNLPWKDTKDPYLIWLSEIILQQTRVAQGTPYFLKFAKAYPKVQHLADAPEDEVMRMWEGLGYYSRARNLHAAAKYVAYELNGKFPETYETIIKLKGVGAYTAAAIASFAYGLPHAVVDGNVFRVLSRYFGIDTPIDTTAGKKQFTQLANELLDATAAGYYNQAIMDFGATQCKPANPDCGACPMQLDCAAYQNGTIDQLPVKSKKLIKKSRFFNYLVIQADDKYFIRKRVEKDIWRNLYEFPMIESSIILKKNSLQTSTEWQEWLGKSETEIVAVSTIFKQLLTHQKIHACFFEVKIKEAIFSKKADWIAISKNELPRYAFPKIMNTYLEQKAKGSQQMTLDF